MLNGCLSPKAAYNRLDLSAVRLVSSEKLPSLHSILHQPHHRSFEASAKVGAYTRHDIGREGLKKSSSGLRIRQRRLQAASMSGLVGDTFYLDEFAFRQFEGGHAAQLDVSKEDFIQTVHKLYHELSLLTTLNDGP